jgi:hypothetical protein
MDSNAQSILASVCATTHSKDSNAQFILAALCVAGQCKYSKAQPILAEGMLQVSLMNVKLSKS